VTQRHPGPLPRDFDPEGCNRDLQTLSLSPRRGGDNEQVRHEHDAWPIRAVGSPPITFHDNAPRALTRSQQVMNIRVITAIWGSIRR
jgi:hypothetical protein